jgi:hypothetical protein
LVTCSPLLAASSRAKREFGRAPSNRTKSRPMLSKPAKVVLPHKLVSAQHSRRVRRAIPCVEREASMHPPSSSAAARRCKPLSRSPAAGEAATPPPRKPKVAQPGLDTDATWHQQHAEVSMDIKQAGRFAPHCSCNRKLWPARDPPGV